jgi:hypothetical protein
VGRAGAKALLWAALAASAPVRAGAGDAPPEPGCTCCEQCADRNGRGSVCMEGACTPYQDRTSLLALIGLERDRAGPPPPFELLPAAFPDVGYNPAMGFILGAGGTLGMYLGDPRDTTISSLQAVAIVTTKKQLNIRLASAVLTSGNDWELQGDWRFLIYNQDTYGLGTGPSQDGAAASLLGVATGMVQGAQRMDFNLIRFHETVTRRVWGHLYAGAAYRLDRYYGVKDLALDLTSTPPAITSAYAYGMLHGFDPSQYTVSGLGPALAFDSRDSTINPYRGLYAALEFDANPTFLGSSRPSTFLSGEFRAYVGMSDAVPRNVLAFWLYFQCVTSGQLPYLALPSIGWDAANRTGRGYVQGRFRGTAEAYLEVEWRFRITSDGLFGGVLFANVSSFSAPAMAIPGYSIPGQKLLQYLRPAGGVGLRVMMNRESRSNLTIDVGVGENSFGLWFNVGEYF